MENDVTVAATDDPDRTERAVYEDDAQATQLASGGDVCPRCRTAYSRAALKPPDFKCACGLELAYPLLAPNGEVKELLGWLASPGAVLHNRYRVLQLLGRGGFGTTYLVEDLKLSNKRWALKEIPESHYDEHESRILAKLRHPSIPGITDREMANGMVYIVLEFGGNRTLESVRRATVEKRLPLSQLAPWVRQLCDVLGYLHAQTPPVVHRDLKPGNVLLDDQDRVMLIDFGIAKDVVASEQTHTLGRAVTHGFSPPEQAMGAGTDERSDVYALGATVYFLLTGQRPPGARERIQGVAVPPPSDIVPGTPPAIDRALIRALSLNPNERQQSVLEFGRAFDYEAPTVATYDDPLAGERTVLANDAPTARTGPGAATQQSLKLGADGTVEVVATGPRSAPATVATPTVALPATAPATPGPRRSGWLVPAALALVALGAGGTWWLTRAPAPSAIAPPAAPVAPVAPALPAASAPAAAPATTPALAPEPALPAPVAAAAQIAVPTAIPNVPLPTPVPLPAVAAPVITERPPAPPANASAQPATPAIPPGTPVAVPVKPATTEVAKAAPAPATVPAAKPKPKPAVATTPVRPPEPAPPPPVELVPSMAPAGNAWQKANSDTQFQE
ncbi:MAG: serine/threonine protein kinase [Gammaproteobacteria bacterium]|nr:serine/threonine protein kinase [Gammaproteobacteria bacterium]